MAGEYDARFEAIVGRVIRREGGYVNHPNDKGGPTKYGITMNFYREAFGEEPDRSTIKALTVDRARQAYHAIIWQKYGVNRLPSEIQPLMFEWITISGPDAPTKLLQEKVGATPDGIIGPKTVRAVRESLSGDFFGLWHREFLNDIVRFFIRIARRDPSQIVFLEGWFNRFSEYYLDQ